MDLLIDGQEFKGKCTRDPVVYRSQHSNQQNLHDRVHIMAVSDEQSFASKDGAMAIGDQFGAFLSEPVTGKVKNTIMARDPEGNNNGIFALHKRAPPRFPVIQESLATDPMVNWVSTMARLPPAKELSSALRAQYL